MRFTLQRYPVDYSPIIKYLVNGSVHNTIFDCMEITIIGSGTAVPALHRASPCVLARTGGTTLLCDTGPGTLRQMLKAGVTVADVDQIIYTHLHIDHTADLAPFLFAARYAPELRRTKGLTIMGPPGIRQFYNNLTVAYGDWIIPDNFSIDWIELQSDTIQLQDCTVTGAPVAHTQNSIAVRLEDNAGRTVVYSGDTDYCPGIVALARCADILILECSFPEHMRRAGHLIPSLAGRIARESACKKLVLTHLYPPCETADMLTPLGEQFSGETVIARDLMKMHL